MKIRAVLIIFFFLFANLKPLNTGDILDIANIKKALNYTTIAVTGATLTVGAVILTLKIIGGCKCKFTEHCPTAIDPPTKLTCSAACIFFCRAWDALSVISMALGMISFIVNLFAQNTTQTNPENPNLNTTLCDDKQGSAYDVCKCERIDGGRYISLGPNYTNSVSFMCFLNGQSCELIKGFNDEAYKECVCNASNWTWDDEAKQCIEKYNEIPDIEMGALLASGFNIDADLSQELETLDESSDSGAADQANNGGGSSKASSLGALKLAKYKESKEKEADKKELDTISPSNNSFLQNNKNFNKKEKEAFNSSFLRAQARQDILKETDDLFKIISKAYINYQLTIDMIQK